MTFPSIRTLSSENYCGYPPRVPRPAAIQPLGGDGTCDLRPATCDRVVCRSLVGSEWGEEAIMALSARHG